MRSFWAKVLLYLSQIHLGIWFFLIAMANFPIQYNQTLLALVLDISLMLLFIGHLKAKHLQVLYQHLYPHQQRSIFMKRLENYYQQSSMHFYHSPQTFFNQSEMEVLTKNVHSILSFKDFIKSHKE